MGIGKLSAKKCIEQYRKHNSVFWGAMFLLYGIIFYSKFIRNVIPPQVGWWQYMAWRMEQGDLPYKDFYLFMPPYFVFITSFLFRFFGNHIFLYSIFGFFVTRLLMWTLIYKMFIKIVKPVYAVVGLITGLSFTASYLMDAVFDYNPLITFFIVLIAFLFCLLYESKENKKNIGLIFGIGFLTGFLVFMKQTTALLIPPVSLISIAWICKQKNCKAKECLRNIFLFIVGIIFALIPGIVYLLYNNIVYDFIFCMSTSADAKIVDTSMLQLILRNFIRIDELVCAFAIVLCTILIRKYGIKRELVISLISIFVVLLSVYSEFENSIKGFKEGIGDGNFLECIALLMILMIVLYFIDYRIKKYGLNFAVEGIISSLVIIFFLLIFCIEYYLPNSVASILYDEIYFCDLKKDIFYIAIYLTIFIWAEALVSCIFYDKENIKKIFVPFTIILLYLGASFLSASLEELYTILFIPIVIVYCLQFSVKSNIQKYGIAVFCFIMCFCCLSQKLYIPYDWHEWHTPSLLLKEHNIQKSDIEGLEGFYLSENDKNSYKKIISAILDNSSEEDILFQFSSIPLFNVLTERKSLYVAIPYFDVCPDSLAIKTAEELENNFPKLVLFDELSEWRWTLHEDVFRNSNLSGQREILNFYNDYVQKYYRLLGRYDNNVGENVCLWKRTAYNGGKANDVISIRSGKILKQNIQFMQNEFNTIAIEKNIKDNLIGEVFHFVLKNTVTNDVVIDRKIKISEMEDNYYICRIGSQSVNSDEMYELSISYEDGDKCYLGINSDPEDEASFSIDDRQINATLSIILE